jgi:hypothetical protein
MKVSENDLIERYESMTNHELAEIVRSSELTDLAMSCIERVLERRGISDLRSEIDELNMIDQENTDLIKEDLEKKEKSLKSTSKPLYVIGLIFLIVGVLIFVFHEVGSMLYGSDSGLTEKGKVGLGAILLGAIMISVGYIRVKIRMLIAKLLKRL